MAKAWRCVLTNAWRANNVTYPSAVKSGWKTLRYVTYGAHEGVKDADSERRATGEWLSHVQFGPRVIVIILVKELDIGVITYRQTQIV